MVQCAAFVSSYYLPQHPNFLCVTPGPPTLPAFKITASFLSKTTRRSLLTVPVASSVLIFCAFSSANPLAETGISEFTELEGSGGVKALDLRIGSGELPVDGDQVVTHSLSEQYFLSSR